MFSEVCVLCQLIVLQRIMRVEEDRNLPGDKNVTIPRQVRVISDMEILVHIGILVATKYFGSQKILTKLTAILS